MKIEIELKIVLFDTSNNNVFFNFEVIPDLTKVKQNVPEGPIRKHKISSRKPRPTEFAG
jgi:hypothetical protein